MKRVIPLEDQIVSRRDALVLGSRSLAGVVRTTRCVVAQSRYPERPIRLVIPSERRRHDLGSTQVEIIIGGCLGIDHECHACKLRLNLLEMLSHLPVTLASNIVRPVRLRPGCTRLGTKPWPTASAIPMNTIGTVRVSR